jgi:hypothetical protein
VRQVAKVLGVPFISQEMEWIGREAGDQAAADGAPLTLWLLEEEMTRWLFDEGEMKRRQRRISSLA